MPVDPRGFRKLNVADTCAVWNVLASPLLTARAREAGCHLSCTGFVIYECLYKPRKTTRQAEVDLMNRLRKEQASGRLAVYHLDVDDLNDVEILQQRMRLGKGELASIAFAKRTQQAFLTDDQRARKLAASMLQPHEVQTTPHLFGWLMYEGFLGDADKDTVIAQHQASERPLTKFFEEMYVIVLQYRAHVAAPPSPNSA
jgi:hypothetical protein